MTYRSTLNPFENKNDLEVAVSHQKFKRNIEMTIKRLKYVEPGKR